MSNIVIAKCKKSQTSDAVIKNMYSPCIHWKSRKSDASYTRYVAYKVINFQIIAK